MSNDPTTDLRTALTFYPSVRQGYRPSTEFDASEVVVTDPSELSITLDVTGHGSNGEIETTRPSVDLHVYGPGDVVGLDESQVIRTDPAPGTTDFPPNYFPFVEFDRADLPWLFSPTRADDRGRNRPWCCLVVVDKHAEGVDLQQGGTGPLPVLTAPTDELPDLTESWAWAHVQSLGGRPTSPTAERDQFVGREDRTLSRLVCPRNLRTSRTYIAAVVPTYEPGRRAGLGEEPFPGAGESGEEGSEGSDAGTETEPEEAPPSPPVEPAWRSTDSRVRLPVYYQWEFATGPEGDFEQLVRLLTPRDLGSEVGERTIDTSDPGPPVLRYGADDPAATVGMGGALRSADVEPDRDPYGESGEAETDAEAALRDLVNQPERVVDELGIPAIGPPKYGQWPADRLVVSGPDGEASDEGGFLQWLHELNVSPQHRTAAGFGTQVVQNRQEDLVARAWDQFGDLVAANERTRVTRLADDTLRRTFDPLAEADLGDLLRLAGPVLGFSDGLAGNTILRELGLSGVPPGVTTPAFRRFTRPNGPLGRRSNITFDQGTFIEQFVDVDRDAVGAGGEVQPGTEHRDVDRDFGAAVENHVSADDLFGTAAFADYGRSLEEFASMRGLPDGGEPFGADGPPTVPRWRVGPNGEPMSVERAIEFHERNPDADPGGRAVARAVDAVRTLETAAVDVQRDLAVARVRLSGSGSGSDESAALASVGTSLAALDDETIETAEAALTALAERPGTPDDPSLDAETVEAALGELRRHRTQLSETIEAGGADDAATRLRTAEQPLARVVETLGGLREHVDVGPVETVGRTATDPLAAPFVSMQPGAIDDVTSTAVPRVALAATDTVDRSVTDAVDVRKMRTPLLFALDPTFALRMRLSDIIGIDPDQLAARPDPLAEVMAHPRYYEPMYEALRDLDQEYLLPGADGIPKNTVGAVVTNPPFIEAFMTGLNHEQSRELRWRRFPTDRRGTYFRHFWDRRGDPTTSGDPEARADITPIHQWGTTGLGTHQARSRRTAQTRDESDSDEENETLGTVVLLVRGDLFDRYPNTHIYAAKAVESTSAASSDGSGDRVPYMPGRPETPRPDDDEFVGDSLHVYPDFRGTLDPGITFFGFDLTVDEAVNDPYHEEDDPPNDHPDEGWFFVIEEPPGELHFGLDEASPGDVGTIPVGISHESSSPVPVAGDEDVDRVEKGWSGLSWGHLVTEGDPEATRFVPVESGPPGDGNWSVDDGQVYHTDEHGDRVWGPEDAATWGENSAHMARITMQQPVRVSIHADDLLPDGVRETTASREDE